MDLSKIVEYKACSHLEAENLLTEALKGYSYMITKEQCRDLFNYYAQIERSESLINDLKKIVEKCDGQVPDVFDKNYTTYGSIQLVVPFFKNGEFSSENAGQTVYNINYKDAILVLKNHVKSLKKKAETLSNEMQGKTVENGIKENMGEDDLEALLNECNKEQLVNLLYNVVQMHLDEHERFLFKQKVMDITMTKCEG